MTEFFIFRSALLEYLKPKRLVIWGLLAIGLAILGKVWSEAGSSDSPEVVYGQISSILVFRIVGLVSALFTTSIISQEVEGKTIAYLLTRPVERWKLIIARYLASVVAVAVVGILGAAGTSYGIWGVAGFGYTPFWNDFKAICFGAFAYGALFLLISLLVNRAMIVCLLYAFGVETIVPNMPGESGYLAIVSYIEAIAKHQPPMDTNSLEGFLSRAMGLNTISPGTGMTFLTVFAIVIAGVSALWFTQFEYVPREDAE